ncbi:MAG: transposase, partial [Acidobacteria bacterium]
MGKAITYTLKQWPKLIQFLEDGELELSTNWVENSIRPFVAGRKGWLFAGSPEGAESSAIMYSLVETAKACGWEPFSYLNTLFEK